MSVSKGDSGAVAAGRKGGEIGGPAFRERHRNDPAFREHHRQVTTAARRKGIAERRQKLVDECREVPTEPFVKRFNEMRARGETNGCILAREFGFMRPPPSPRHHGPQPDSTRMLRSFGVKAQKDGKTGRRYYKHTIRYEFAVKLAGLLGMDPQDAGI